LIYEAKQIAMPPAAPPQEDLTFWQESGTRPSRPTPYVQHVTSQVNTSGTISLHFINNGRQGTVFHVYDRLHLDRVPRRYTVEAGKSLEDNAWDTSDADGAYDLDVYSANGFVRTFKGNVSEEGSATLHLRIIYDVRRSAIRAVIHNPGSKLAKFQVKPNKYMKDGRWTASVAANESVEQSWNISDYGNWYDFTVTAPGFERRFAGRMENGSNLTSDPAMGT
jgi:phospholipase C